MGKTQNSCDIPDPISTNVTPKILGSLDPNIHATAETPKFQLQQLKLAALDLQRSPQ